jgi:hypothetical protein
VSRGSGRKAADAQASTPEPTPTDDQLQSEVDEQQKLVQEDPYGSLEGMTPNEAIASSVGAPNDYPYIDKSSMPVHERNFSNMNPNHEPSQADLNPAFSPKPEDGGQTSDGSDGVIEGTEPNANDKALAAAENSGQEGAVEAVQEQIDAGAEQQIDAEKVTAAAQERAPEGIDASTGQKEGEATVPGAPSGMESQTDLGSNGDAKNS